MTRVVVTGLGVVAPNAIGIAEFERALRHGRSGIRFVPELSEHKFGCHVAGVPDLSRVPETLFTEEELLRVNSVMTLATCAGVECWQDAGFSLDGREGDHVDWDTGLVIGTGFGGIDTVADTLVPKTNSGQVRRLGSTVAERAMFSGAAACVSGDLGLGGHVSAVSSACSSGTEAIATGFHTIRDGRAKRVLTGGAEGVSIHTWAMFDGMRVLARHKNDAPELASRPMSASAGGFVPAAGAGFLLLEALDSAEARDAHIYAEVLGCAVNSGGQRQGGTITAPNPVGVQRCIREAVARAGIRPTDVGLINGHLTATYADPLEINNWRCALGVPDQAFPMVNSTKSLIGHTLGAAGAIESVASVLQLARGFVHGSINCEDLHPELEPIRARIPQETVCSDARVLAKTSFGFGDVNACVIFQRWAD